MDVRCERVCAVIFFLYLKVSLSNSPQTHYLPTLQEILSGVSLSEIKTSNRQILLKQKRWEGEKLNSNASGNTLSFGSGIS